MIIPNDRYTMPESENSMYAAQMILSIRKLHKNDFGGYKCISKNSIGDAEGLIRLYGEFFLFNEIYLVLRTSRLCEHWLSLFSAGGL